MAKIEKNGIISLLVETFSQAPWMQISLHANVLMFFWFFFPHLPLMLPLVSLALSSPNPLTNCKEQAQQQVVAPFSL